MEKHVVQASGHIGFAVDSTRQSRSLHLALRIDSYVPLEPKRANSRGDARVNINPGYAAVGALTS
jgi:hypothetical protein